MEHNLTECRKAGEYLLVPSGSKEVVLLHPEAFECLFEECRASQLKGTRARLERDAASTQSINKKKQLKGRIQAARRQQALFWPKSKRLQLSGLRLPGENGSEIKVSDPLLCRLL